MKNAPEISVIMSVYNGEKYLKEAIDSVISQTFTDWELIITDDCSSDKTPEILKQYAAADSRIKVLTNEKNLKLPASLNRALSQARGKYIARLDADDVCLSRRLEKQHEFMESSPDISISSCRFISKKGMIYCSGGGGGNCKADQMKALLLVTNPVLHPGVIAKSSVLKSLKYDEELTCTEDLELWTRAAACGYKIEVQDEYLMIYRLHENQITQNSDAGQRREVLAIEKKYYKELLGELSDEEWDFYISGIYFRDRPDIKKFCNFYKRIKRANDEKGKVDKNALEYAAFEILAEYKRCSVGKFKILYAMMFFDKKFLIAEMRRRKKKAREDGMRCIKAAEEIGLGQVNDAVEYPIFKKR